MNKPVRRLYCALCLRAKSACICRWITPVVHSIEVLILQHSMEVHNAKGSAHLLHLSLSNSRLVAGETLDTNDLKELLFAPLCPAGLPERQAVLLYPDPPWENAQTAPLNLPARLLAGSQITTKPPLRLVVIDATWRKSRKMLHQNPLLAQLPRLSLKNTATSRYSIRKAHRPDQLSTLEATCAALAQLEGNGAAFLPLLSAFDGFVAQQLSYATPASMVRNH